MASSSSAPQPIGESDIRFARFTPDNHSAVLWITSLLSLIYAILVLIVRLGFVKRRAHGLDDVVVTLAHVCIQRLLICTTISINRLTAVQLVGIGMWGSLFASLSNGLGQSLKVLDDAEISQMQKVSQMPSSMGLTKKQNRANTTVSHSSQAVSYCILDLLYRSALLSSSSRPSSNGTLTAFCTWLTAPWLLLRCGAWLAFLRSVSVVHPIASYQNRVVAIASIQ